MAVPYMFGPGGQPILMGQIPLLPQAPPQVPISQFQQVPPQQPQPAQPKMPDYMNEEKLQEKGWSCYDSHGRIFPNV